MPADDPFLGMQQGERVVARFFDDFPQELGGFFEFIALVTFIDASVGEALFHYPPILQLPKSFQFFFPQQYWTKSSPSRYSYCPGQ